MKYYNLAGKNTLVVRVEDERTAEFTGKAPAQKLVSRYEDMFRGVYSESNLMSMFPNMKEIKRVPYAKAVDNINDFNSKQAASQQKLDGLPIEEMNNYIVMFPAKNPKLLNYEQLNKIRYMMFVASREIDEPLKEPTQETLLSLTKGLYSLLKDAEESNNRKYLNAILRAGKNLRPEDYGFTTSEGGQRGEESTGGPDGSEQSDS